MDVQITFNLKMKWPMSFDPCGGQNIMKVYMFVIEDFFRIPLPILSSTYRKGHSNMYNSLIQLN